MLENTREKEKQLEGSSIDGRYVLGSKLGEGGMGMVFRARQLSTNRDVALKVMKLDNLEGTSVERFEREIDIISKLSHPNVVGIHDSGIIEGLGLLYVVMELIDGISLSDVLWHKHAEEQYFKCRSRVEFALEVIYQLCGALTEPHRLGVIHRDIKPENVLLSPRADETIQVKLLDFGIARIMRRDKKKSNTITDASIPFVGTPHYMSPEQVAGTEYDERADIYALGVVLFEMLSGKYPFDDENLFAILLRKTQYDAPKVADTIFGDVEYPEIMDLCDRMLSRDPDKRPASALEVRHEIEDLRDSYRFPRVRIESLSYLNSPHHAWDEEHIEALDPDERLEPARKVFRNWLLYPSGRPLLREEESQESEEDRNREDTIPEGTAALANEVSEPLEEEEGSNEPVRHTMQAWAVASGWTDSFDVGRLQRGAEELEAMFEGTIETEKEEIDEAVTNIWQPNLEDAPEELRAILSGEVRAPFEERTIEQSLEDDLPSPETISELLGEEDLNNMVEQPEGPRESAPMLEPHSSSIPGVQHESGQFESIPGFGSLGAEGSEAIFSSAPRDPFTSDTSLVSGATDFSDATEISDLPDDLAAMIGQTPSQDSPSTFEAEYEEDDFADTQIAPLPPELMQLPQVEEDPELTPRDIAATQKNPSLPPELDRRKDGPRKVALFDDEEEPSFGSVPVHQMLEEAGEAPDFAPTVLDLGGTRVPRQANPSSPRAPQITPAPQPKAVKTQPAQLAPIAKPEPLAVFDQKAQPPTKKPNLGLMVAGAIALALLILTLVVMFAL